ncbi:hypothetical protein CDIK_3266, partial [Cucumispora dikerogammari]
EISEFVENKIRTNCTVTLKTIQENIHAKFLFTLCIKTIRKCLLDISITLKKLNCTEKAVNALKSKELRKEYANYFLNDLIIENKYIIFIKKKTFNLTIRRNYERCRTGTRATAVVLTNRVRNLLLISAINEKKVLYRIVIKGGAKAQDFKQLLLCLFCPFRLRS